MDSLDQMGRIPTEQPAVTNRSRPEKYASRLEENSVISFARGFVCTVTAQLPLWVHCFSFHFSLIEINSITVSARDGPDPDISTGSPADTAARPVGYQAQSNIGSEGRQSYSYHYLEALSRSFNYALHQLSGFRRPSTCVCLSLKLS